MRLYGQLSGKLTINEASVNKNLIDMNTKNLILIIILTFFALSSNGQTQNDSISTMHQDSTAKIQQIERKAEIQPIDVPIYKLFPTQNY